MMGDDMAAGKLLDLAAVAVNSAAADLAAASAESDGEEEHACSWSRTGSGATNVYEEGEGSEGDEEDNGVGGKQKRALPTDSERRARNRERNRLHARKTRQRKKQHVQELQLKIWGLRQERQRLLQLSTDHRTAGVLLALSCSPKQCIQGAGPLSAGSPRVPSALELPDAATKAAAGRGRDWSREVASHEEALRKITQEFESMDGSQQLGEEEGETGALIAVRDRAQSSSSSSSSGGGGGCKGGSRGVKGTLSDRTALRRERNRMHAKRTRNRKKLFVEACSVMIDKMKVENAQLEHEIRASGIHLPHEDWRDDVRETIPEEPLPEYLAALWDFAEGKSHNPKTQAVGASTNSSSSSSSSSGTTTATVTSPTTPKAPSGGSVRQSRQLSSSSTSSSSSSFSVASSYSSFCPPTGNRQEEGVSTGTTTKAPRRPPSSPEASSTQRASQLPAAASAAAGTAVAASNPGEALEDASALCAFMEAAQTRSAKRARVVPPTQQQPQLQQQTRGWSDHGSTTSESRGGSEFSEEDASNERKSGVDNSGKDEAPREASALLSPALWTSRQVLERYVLPRPQLLQG